jgi:hypothetical protein
VKAAEASVRMDGSNNNTSLVSEQTMESGTEKISPAPEVEIKRGRSALGTSL